MSGRVFVTGDKHGTFVPLFGFAEKTELYDTDILIIAGDAGYIWDENYKYAVESLEQIFPGTIAFVDGNHENHQLINSMEEGFWNGGTVHKIGERIYHLMRGEIYSIYGRQFFVFGGARSVDKDRRVEGTSWWSEEEPTKEELEYGKNQLCQNIDKIDYVITHETPRFARLHISRSKPIDPDYMLPTVFEEWYRIIQNGKRFKKWYFGHMHVDQAIADDLHGIHHNILLVGEDECIRWA